MNDLPSRNCDERLSIFRYVYYSAFSIFVITERCFSWHELFICDFDQIAFLKAIVDDDQCLFFALYPLFAYNTLKSSTLTVLQSMLVLSVKWGLTSNTPQLSFKIVFGPTAVVLVKLTHSYPLLCFLNSICINYLVEKFCTSVISNVSDLIKRDVVYNFRFLNKVDTITLFYHIGYLK